MSTKYWSLALICTTLTPVFAQPNEAPTPDLNRAEKSSDLPQASIPAFPGAQGGGMFSFGGRGGKVYVVTSLDDSGTGSFREACEAAGPRIIIFNVAGIIRLDKRITIKNPYVTIAGNTAPGDGVCIAGNTVELSTHDVIVRYMRFRRGITDKNQRNDSLGGNPSGNIIIDHVSASWGLDENMSIYAHRFKTADGKELKLSTVNVTIQNSIFSEALDTYGHAFGSTLGGQNSTFHHNLWANNTARNSSVGMIYDFTFANNVVYNWRHRSIDGGDQRSFYNIINNYFKPGPATDKSKPISYRIIKPESRRGNEVVKDFGLAYVAGNIVEGNEKVTKDNWDGGVQLDDSDKGTTLPFETVLPQIRVNKPYPHAYLEIESAQETYESVLVSAGASLPCRDAVDTRIVKEVRSGEATYSDGKGIITDIAQVGGYPIYKGKPYTDSDSDGIPDDWELKYGLNPKDASDAVGDLNGDGYTNIEDFINGVAANARKRVWLAPITYVNLWQGKTVADNTWKTSDVITAGK